MAWQLQYTSARSGPTGRAGFQYVGTSPGLPPAWETAAAPYLVYRPPPEAPPAPAGDHDLRRFPESFGYDVVDGHALLVRCRYLGKDYSGRYGNFLGHAVVAAAEELEGLRPIELWRSPIWDAGPGGGPLPVLDDLLPGEAIGPDALGRWLGGTGAYGLLARLLDAVVEVLDRGYGRVVLVGSDAETVARWIAVVSYSLPVTTAAALSFTTYSADPDAAPQRLVGTTPGVWETAGDRAPAFFVDHPESAPPAAAGFGAAVADCWRALDLDGLDGIGELAAASGGGLAAGLRAAATASAFLYDPAGAGAGIDLAAVAAVLRACDSAGVTVPPGHARAAAAEAARRGAGDVAAALRAVPDAAVTGFAEGVLDGLERAAPEVRDALLTGPACDLLLPRAEPGWERWPATGLAVLATAGRRRPELRLAVTRSLLALADAGHREAAEAALGEVWAPEEADRPRPGFVARLRGGRAPAAEG